MVKFTYNLSLCLELEVAAQMEVWIPFHHFVEVEKKPCLMHTTPIDKVGLFFHHYAKYSRYIPPHNLHCLQFSVIKIKYENNKKNI